MEFFAKNLLTDERVCINAKYDDKFKDLEKQISEEKCVYFFHEKEIIDSNELLKNFDKDFDSITFILFQECDEEFCLGHYINREMDRNKIKFFQYINISHDRCEKVLKLLTPKVNHKELVKYNGTFMMFIDEDDQTEELCLSSVGATQSALKYISHNKITTRIIDAFLKKNVMNFQDIPDHMKTPSMCLQVVSKSGLMLEYVPREMITREMCISALREFPRSIKYVPKELMTEEMRILSEDPMSIRFGGGCGQAQGNYIIAIGR